MLGNWAPLVYGVSMKCQITGGVRGAGQSGTACIMNNEHYNVSISALRRAIGQVMPEFFKAMQRQVWCRCNAVHGSLGSVSRAAVPRGCPTNAGMRAQVLYGAGRRMTVPGTVPRCWRLHM